MKSMFIVIMIIVFIPMLPAFAKAEDPEIQRLKESMQQLQDRIDQLEKRSAAVADPAASEHPPEEAESGPSVTDVVSGSPAESAAAAAGATAPESVPAGSESKMPAEGAGADGTPPMRQMQIEYRESFSDIQEAAPRPYDLTLNPEYQGFIPIPHTHFMIQFNARPRTDFTNDTDYSGNPNMFVTGDIPVSGQIEQGGGYQFNVNAQGSQLSIDVRAPKTRGCPRFYYRNDFSATGPYVMNYKLQHLYGEFYNIVTGKTYSVFMDPDAWPDTVDYEGPNAAVSANRPLFRYMLLFGEHWGLTFSLEKPNSQVDTSFDPTGASENKAPDGGFNIKWMDRNLGHVQIGAIFREIGASGATFGEQEGFGWGVNLSSSINTYKRDSFQVQVTYGHGIFSFLNDSTQNGDGAFNANNELKPLPVIAAMAGVTHWWSRLFRSTASFGFVNLDNQTSQQWDAYHRTYYASANVVLQLFRRLSFGFEGLYGYRQVKSGASGDVFRGQASVMYALFK